MQSLKQVLILVGGTPAHPSPAFFFPTHLTWHAADADRYPQGFWGWGGWVNLEPEVFRNCPTQLGLISSSSSPTFGLMIKSLRVWGGVLWSVPLMNHYLLHSLQISHFLVGELKAAAVEGEKKDLHCLVSAQQKYSRLRKELWALMTNWKCGCSVCILWPYEAAPVSASRRPGRLLWSPASSAALISPHERR